MYFYNALWYDPYITQFTQPDSIIPDTYNPLDWNRYAYAQYNPLRYSDPSGHAVCETSTGDDWIVQPFFCKLIRCPSFLLNLQN